MKFLRKYVCMLKDITRITSSSVRHCVPWHASAVSPSAGTVCRRRPRVCPAWRWTLPHLSKAKNKAWNFCENMSVKDHVELYMFKVIEFYVNIVAPLGVEDVVSLSPWSLCQLMVNTWNFWENMHDNDHHSDHSAREELLRSTRT